MTPSLMKNGKLKESDFLEKTKNSGSSFVQYVAMYNQYKITWTLVQTKEPLRSLVLGASKTIKKKPSMEKRKVPVTTLAEDCSSSIQLMLKDVVTLILPVKTMPRIKKEFYPKTDMRINWEKFTDPVYDAPTLICPICSKSSMIEYTEKAHLCWYPEFFEDPHETKRPISIRGEGWPYQKNDWGVLKCSFCNNEWQVGPQYEIDFLEDDKEW